MEQDLLQLIGIFVAGLVVGGTLILLFNKLKSGSATPGNVKQEFDDYKNQVEAHFEETSKKFQDMTAQYQDLYQHLSVGATTLCRSDSVAAGLVDGSGLETNAQLESTIEKEATVVSESDNAETVSDAGESEHADTALNADQTEPKAEQQPTPSEGTKSE